MPTFVDTSGLFALLDVDDLRHSQANAAWNRLNDDHERLITSNYVLVETTALVARRLGLDAVRDLVHNIAPVLVPIWVGEDLHQRAISALLIAGMRDLSIVDCVSFEIMRDLRIDTAFATDDHFRRQGFHCLS